MPRASTLVNGVDGEEIRELADIRADRSVAALHRLIAFGVAPEAEAKLHELIALAEGGLEPSVHVHPVRSRTQPYAVGYDDSDRPWSRYGDLYIYPLRGEKTGNALSPAVEGKENALLVLCCFTA